MGQNGLVQHHRYGLDKSGRGLIGGTLGYNLQTGNWVWGLEGDISYSWIKGTAVGTGFCADVGCQTENRWFGVAASAMPSTAGCPTSPAARPLAT